MRSSLEFLILAFLAQPSYACSAEHLVPIYEPRKVKIPNDLGKVPAPPALAVQIVSIRRAQPDPLSCGSDATFRIKVSWSSSTKQKLSDYGFYIRNLSQDTGDSFSFVNFPVTPRVIDGEAFFDLRVSDEGSLHHKPINVEAEILAVNSRMQIGPGTRFSLVAGAD